MLPQFIYYLIKYIKFQEKIIYGLLGIILGKSVARGLYDEPVNKPYRKLEVDKMPIIETLEKLDYQELLTKKNTVKSLNLLFVAKIVSLKYQKN